MQGALDRYARPQRCRRGFPFTGCRMDKLAVFQCDDTVPQSQRLAIIAQFAAHGIDVAILPAGMEMVAITDGSGDNMDDTD